MRPNKLPTSVLFAYGIGSLGWSISINVISVLLNYIYLPPANAQMNNLIPQMAIFGVFNIISVVLFFGRFFDAAVDPFIAHLSDRSKNKLGRRIPFMRIAFIPMSVFCVLLFFPPTHHESTINIMWMAGTQLLYYMFFGLYLIPYNALLAEMGHDAQAKLDLSTAQSLGFMVGVLVSASSPMMANGLQQYLHITDRLAAYQYSIVALNVLAAITMAIPAYFVDEKKYCVEATVTEPLFKSLSTALKNRNFIIFAIADSSYFMAIAIITAGLMYYVKAMLNLDEGLGTLFMLAMVIITVGFYPIVNKLGTRISKKKMMIASFLAVAGVFAEIFYLGKFPFSPIIQVSVLVITFGIPDAFLGILPNTVVADIAHKNAAETGENKEGMYFGMRALFQKIGQTAGVTVFAMLTLYGKDPGHDLGLRLSGVIGTVLCLVSAIAYSNYEED